MFRLSVPLHSAGDVFLLLVHLHKEHHHDVHLLGSHRDLDNSLPGILAFLLKPVGFLFLSLGEADMTRKSALPCLFTLFSPHRGP